MDPRRAHNRATAKLGRTNWYEIRNQSDKTTVRIFDEIRGAEQFTSELAAITAPTITVDINSPGGDVFDAVAIYSAIRLHPSHVTTRVVGVAASAASVVLQAGDRRVMLGGSQTMVHRAWGLAMGDADELAAFADLLRKQDSVIASIYASRSGRSASQFQRLMAAETWFSDKETVDAGLADVLLEPARKLDANNLYAEFVAAGLPSN